jgi:hypothetical protein
MTTGILKIKITFNRDFVLTKLSKVYIFALLSKIFLTYSARTETLSSMDIVESPTVSYMYAFSWGIVILLSFVGWGTFVNNLVLPEKQADWGLRAAWGISLSVVVGGFLNVTWSISKVCLAIYLFAGFALFLKALYSNRKSITKSFAYIVSRILLDRLFYVFLLTLVCLLLVRYAGSITQSSFNLFDDYQAYFVFPNKMLQIGSIGLDPFSGRRLVSSLGGQSFLDSLVLLNCSEVNLGIIDSGIGTIIVVGVFYGLLDELALSKWYKLCAMFMVSILSPLNINITSQMTAMALYISFFRILRWRMIRHFSCAKLSFSIALLMAALISVKSNMVPATVIFFLSSYTIFAANEERKDRVAAEFLLVLTLVAIFVCSWMFSLYQSSGTFFYPLLGKGYYGTLEDTIGPPSGEITYLYIINSLQKIVIGNKYSVPFLLLSYAVYINRFRLVFEKKILISLFVASGIGALVTGLATDGTNRYLFPFMAATDLILLAVLISDTMIEGGWKSKSPVQNSFILAAFGILFFYNIASSSFSYQQYVENVWFGIHNDCLVEESERRKYLNVQKVVPEGETVLTHLDKPFLLDFSRNNVLIIDAPGTASLPPGMPFFQGSAKLSSYLLRQSIRYFMFNHPSKAPIQKNWKQTDSSTWIGRLKQHYFDLQGNITHISQEKKILHNGSKLTLVDLSESASQ